MYHETCFKMKLREGLGIILDVILAILGACEALTLPFPCHGSHLNHPPLHNADMPESMT